MDYAKAQAAQNRIVGGSRLGESAESARPEIVDVLDRLRFTLDRATECYCSVSSFLARMKGPSPESGSNASNISPVRSGALGEVHDLLDQIGSVLSSANSAACELSRTG